MSFEAISEIRTNLRGEKGSIDQIMELGSRPLSRLSGLFDYAFVGDTLFSW